MAASSPYPASYSVPYSPLSPLSPRPAMYYPTVPAGTTPLTSYAGTPYVATTPTTPSTNFLSQFGTVLPPLSPRRSMTEAGVFNEAQYFPDLRENDEEIDAAVAASLSPSTGNTSYRGCFGGAHPSPREVMNSTAPITTMYSSTSEMVAMNDIMGRIRDVGINPTAKIFVDVGAGPQLRFIEGFIRSGDPVLIETTVANGFISHNSLEDVSHYHTTATIKEIPHEQFVDSLNPLLVGYKSTTGYVVPHSDSHIGLIRRDSNGGPFTRETDAIELTSETIQMVLPVITLTDLLQDPINTQRLVVERSANLIKTQVFLMKNKIAAAKDQLNELIIKLSSLEQLYSAASTNMESIVAGLHHKQELYFQQANEGSFALSPLSPRPITNLTVDYNTTSIITEDQDVVALSPRQSAVAVKNAFDLAAAAVTTNFNIMNNINRDIDNTINSLDINTSINSVNTITQNLARAHFQDTEVTAFKR